MKKGPARSVIDLSDDRAIVTAGANGIGLSIVQVLVERGVKVHVADIDCDALARVQERLPVSVTVGDVSDPALVDRLFRDAENALGGLDILVNNVGISGPAGPPHEIPIEEWDRVQKTNVSSMFYCVRRAIPLFRNAGGGVIINMSSAGIRRGGLPLRLPYAVSKTAVLGMTETLAMDLGVDNIRVHTVLPGIVKGERQDRVIENWAKEINKPAASLRQAALKSTSMRTAVDASEVAEVVAFLCSDAARHVSCQAISVCGNFEGHRTGFGLDETLDG